MVMPVKVGNGFNGHAKPARTMEKGKGTTPKKRRSQGAAEAKSTKATRSRGVRVERRFSTPGIDPLDAVVYERRSSIITNPDGSVVFKMEGAEIPAELVAARDRHRRLQVLPQGRPPRRQGRGRDERPPGRAPHRAHHPRRRASSFGGYFATQGRRRHVRGRALVPARATSTARSTRRSGSTAASSTSYGIDGLGRQLGVEPRRPTASSRRRNAYERPQCSACFIQAVDDDLMSIYDLVKNEARLFKYGSGTGSNFSAHPRPAGEALGRRHVERAS